MIAVPVTVENARAMALRLPGVGVKPHFGKPAFHVDVPKGTIFATLWEKDEGISLKLTPQAQRTFCAKSPKAFEAIDSKWGKQGWTWCSLAAVTKKDLDAALRVAHGQGAPPSERARS